jgi:hypothetical protein
MVDKMDHLLLQLPGEPPPVDLALRICQSIRMRRKRISRQRLVLSGILAILGLWLALPPITAWIFGFALPDSGLPMLYEWVELALAGIGTFLLNAVSGVTAFQSGFTTLNIPALLGLAALALSALLALDFLMPRAES